MKAKFLSIEAHISDLRFLLLGLAFLSYVAHAQTSPTSSKHHAPTLRGPVALSAVPASEDDYYKIITLPIPEGVVLEVGGLASLPDGRLAVSTRRGDVWMIGNPYLAGNAGPSYRRFASGLHEPLGLAYNDGDLYLSQRSEVTRLRDRDGDSRADDYDNVYSWPLSGNYHEYSYGPLFTSDGGMLITLNLAWVGKGASFAPWRGWMIKIMPDGKMHPIASGMRSPAGFGMNAQGDVFYAENQGDWVGSGRITHVVPGDFVGNPEGLRWSGEPNSPVKLKKTDIPSTDNPMFEVAKKIPGLKPPAVWFPHGLLGTSTSDIITDTTKGSFGPFEEQLFVGDQGQSKITRVALEKINGVYQGAVFPFREGFMSGILRMVWGNDGSMFVGMTSRGWTSTGKEPFGLQRLVWTGKMPFEMKTIRAQPDGFEIEFTRSVDKAAASDMESYKITGFNYKYHLAYGSPVINQEPCPITGIVVSDDGLKVRLVVDNLREGYIHELKAEGVYSTANNSLLHPVGYYTLNSIPIGEKLNLPKTVIPKQSDSSHTAIGHNIPGPKKPARKNLVVKGTPTGSIAKHVTTRPANWSDEVVTINMGTKPGLKFNPEQFQVKAGSRIKVVFHNNDDMLHNFVVVLPGTAIDVGEQAIKLGLDGLELNYIPNTEKVLHYTTLLQPELTQTIYFTAPDKPGDYTYVCTVPGHFYVMQGIMKVVK